LQSWHLASV